jgi:hypothetical protein
LLCGASRRCSRNRTDASNPAWAALCAAPSRLHPQTMTDGTNVKPDPEDAKVDKIVKSIGRGC